MALSFVNFVHLGPTYATPWCWRAATAARGPSESVTSDSSSIGAVEACNVAHSLSSVAVGLGTSLTVLSPPLDRSP